MSTIRDGDRIFSTLDTSQPFLSMLLDEVSIEVTTFLTPWGLFKVMYLGLNLQINLSKHVVAVVLHQKSEDSKEFISVRTKTLKPYKRRYCLTKRGAAGTGA